MENYKVMQRLGKGAQGSVFLVQNLQDKQHYVLKKVECNDEIEANKAFKEAMALNELRHPYICGYREFFVTWDKEEAAMFVCIVMDYYKMGDLDRVLKQRRKHKQPLEEIIIKKWLGQMIEALVFVHKKEVIHRDLKPSNIFLKEDLSLSIGDFGVATIMGDKRTKTRTTVGSMNWMAPEVLERPYDERSDVWSLGCIALEMITCHILDSTQMSGHLFELKNNPQLLEDVLNRVSLDKCDNAAASSSSPAAPKLYSLELCATIRTMLRRNFEQRPKAVDLVDFPYVQQCLRLNVSTLAQRDAAGDAAAAAAADNAGTKSSSSSSSSRESEAAAVVGGSVDEVVAFLVDRKDDEASVRQGLVQLERLAKTQSQFHLPSAGQRVLLHILQTFRKSGQGSSGGSGGEDGGGGGGEVRTGESPPTAACCAILAASLMSEEEADPNMNSPEMIRAVIDVMRTHVGNQSVQLSACQLLMGLSADETACELIGKFGGIQDILGALRAFHSDVQICAACCSALWSLTVNENNAQLVTEEKGISDVVSALKTHGTKPDVEAVDLVESACAALLSLSMEEENIETMRQSNSMALLVSAVRYHIGNAMVVKNAALAMASLAESDEVSALKVFKDPGSGASEAGAGNDVIAASSAPSAKLSASESDDVITDFGTVSVKESGPAPSKDSETALVAAEAALKTVKGIPIILKAYEIHKDNVEVVEAIVILLLELAEYDDLRTVLTTRQLHETLLKEALDKFPDKDEVASPAQACIEKLTEAS